MNEAPLVVAVIGTFRNSAVAAATLENLWGQSGVDLNAIVVDHGSSAEYLKSLESIGQTEIVTLADDLGYAALNNVGIRIAIERRAAACLIVNPDVRFPTTSSLSELFAFGAQNPDCGVVAPVEVNGFTQELTRLGFDLSPQGLVSALTDASQRGAQIFGPSGCCFLVMSRLLEQGFQLDERLYFNCEELDVGFRASRAELKVISHPTVECHHFSKTPDGPLQLYYQVRNNLFILALNGRGGQAAAFLARQSARLVFKSIVPRATGKHWMPSDLEPVYLGPALKDAFFRRYGRIRPASERALQRKP